MTNKIKKTIFPFEDRSNVAKTTAHVPKAIRLKIRAMLRISHLISLDMLVTLLNLTIIPMV